jgi:hypothetical protein
MHEFEVLRSGHYGAVASGQDRNCVLPACNDFQIHLLYGKA